ncbi:MAG TPA: hypothetical protein VF950_17455 [Planctomycetota bacterium]
MWILLLAVLATQDPWDLGRDRGLNKEQPRDYGNPGLWYGTPGVVPGNDLIRPVRELVRDPDRLLDFRPRKIPGYQDPELQRFNRIYERGLELPRRELPPDR